MTAWRASSNIPVLEAAPPAAPPRPRPPKPEPRPDREVSQWLWMKPLGAVVGMPNPPTSVLRTFMAQTGKQPVINAVLWRFARHCYRRQTELYRDATQPICADEALADLEQARKDITS